MLLIISATLWELNKARLNCEGQGERERGKPKIRLTIGEPWHPTAREIELIKVPEIVRHNRHKSMGIQLSHII